MDRAMKQSPRQFHKIFLHLKIDSYLKISYIKIESYLKFFSMWCKKTLQLKITKK